MFLRKYEKQFVCGYTILTEGLFITQRRRMLASQSDELCTLRRIDVSSAAHYGTSGVRWSVAEVFWDVAPCRLVNTYKSFGRT